MGMGGVVTNWGLWYFENIKKKDGRQLLIFMVTLLFVNTTNCQNTYLSVKY